MLTTEALTRTQIADELRERLIRTRRRVEYARAWLTEIESELVAIDEHLRTLDP